LAAKFVIAPLYEKKRDFRIMKQDQRCDNCVDKISKDDSETVSHTLSQILSLRCCMKIHLRPISGVRERVSLCGP
jgi:hypothetical protein